MPELPEVETTLRGIEPHLLGQRIKQLIVRQRRLRWPVPRGLEQKLSGKRIQQINRRGKYLLLSVDNGTLIIHLGMSGSLRMLTNTPAAGPHDHVDLLLDNGRCLRFTDPRRFGAWLWTDKPVGQHPLLAQLGPEPLSTAFNADYLYKRSRGRKLAVKNFVMNSRIVVGVGNIYANEALFRAGIHPARSAGRISRHRYARLVEAIKAVLADAIKQGGTTLRDFVGGEGKPGYFRQSLQVYGQRGAPCPHCATPIKERRIGQRSSFFCPVCQR
jgi:formamidopyrimidine-DNA glycosylase